MKTILKAFGLVARLLTLVAVASVCAFASEEQRVVEKIEAVELKGEEPVQRVELRKVTLTKTP